MDEIARDLQMSKKTIYKHFQSKDALLEAVADMRVASSQLIFKNIVESDEDCVTKIVLIINAMKKHSMNCSESWFRDLRVHAPHLMKKFEDVRARMVYQIITRLIEQGKKEKLIEHVPPSILITAFIGAMDGVTNSELVMNSKFSIHDIMKITTEIFLGGFLTPLGREKYSHKKKILENALQ